MDLLVLSLMKVCIRAICKRSGKPFVNTNYFECKNILSKKKLKFLLSNFYVLPPFFFDFPVVNLRLVFFFSSDLKKSSD